MTVAGHLVMVSVMVSYEVMVVKEALLVTDPEDKAVEEVLKYPVELAVAEPMVEETLKSPVELAVADPTLEELLKSPVELTVADPTLELRADEDPTPELAGVEAALELLDLYEVIVMVDVVK